MFARAIVSTPAAYHFHPYPESGTSRKRSPWRTRLKRLYHLTKDDYWVFRLEDGNGTVPMAGENVSFADH